MILVFLGPPGSGKGTQAKRFSAENAIPQLSTGDMLRKAISSGTALGIMAQGFMSQGALVPDDVVIGLIRERIEEPDCSKGFILDGFPRTIPQAQALNTLLSGRSQRIGMAILFQIEDGVLVARLTGRRTCSNCGAMFHVESMRPKSEGVCDTCGGALIQRDDDREEVIRKRLTVYHEQTAPLVDFYRNEGLLAPLRADLSPDQVYQNLSKSVNLSV